MTSKTNDRSTFLGATDIPAILGLSPWRTAWEIWAEKTGRLEPRPAGEAAEAGIALEPAVLRWAETQIGPIEPGGTVSIPGTPIICHPDGVAQKDRSPVEAKTSGITGPIYGQWGQPGTDQIPDYYLVQAHIQIAALKAAVCYVPVLLGGYGFRLYEVPQHSLVEEALIEKACQWWKEHVEADRPPPLESPPPLEIFKYIRRIPAKRIELPDVALADEYEAAAENARKAEEYRQTIQRRILAILGDAEEAVLPDGRRIVCRKQFRRGYTVPDHEVLYFRILKGGKRND